MGGFLTGKKYPSQNCIKFGSSEKSLWISSPHHMSWLNDKTRCCLTKQEWKNPESRTLLSPERCHPSAKGQVGLWEDFCCCILKNETVSPSAMTVVSKNSCKVVQTDDKSMLRERAGVCHVVKTHLTKTKAFHAEGKTEQLRPSSLSDIYQKCQISTGL